MDIEINQLPLLGTPEGTDVMPISRGDSFTKKITVQQLMDFVGAGVGITSMEIDINGHLIVTYTDTTTDDLGLVTGIAGLGIASVAIDGSNHLIITYSDATTEDAGLLPGDGRFGIANTSGVYTFYTTLQDAITASVSGQVVEFFTDYSETGNVSVILKNGVNINGNGHTYTLSTATTANALKDNNVAVVCSINNLNVVRAGSSNNNFDSLCLEILNTGTKINCSGTVLKNDSGVCLNNKGRISGIEINALGIGAWNLNTLASMHNVISVSTNNIGIQNNTGKLYYCYGENISGGYEGIENLDFAYYCTGRSASYFGFDNNNTGTAYHCTGISSANIGFFSNGYSSFCCGYSSASIGFSSGNDSDYSYGYSLVSYGFINGNVANSRNATGISFLAPAMYIAKSIKNGMAVCKWNNASGHAIEFNASVGTTGLKVIGCSLEVANSAAYGIFKNVTVSAYIAKNIFEGTANTIHANITQQQVNTEDSFGNLIIG